MKITVPEYYTEFRCIADRCKDSCCIGWEIDVDDLTRRKYEALEGALGREIAEKTSHGCFPLKENGRCAFLDDRGLCRIISALGDGYLCDICREHPRYYGVGNGVIEGGLGLGCEEAARMILALDKAPLLVELEREVHYFDEDRYGDLSEYFRTRLISCVFEKPIEELVRSYVYYGTLADDVAFETVSVGKRALFLDVRSGNADLESAEEIYTATLDALAECESLTEEWDTLIEKARKVDVKTALDALDGMRGLVYYFTHRYVREGIEDMSIYPRIDFAIGSAMVVAAISTVIGGDDAKIRAAVEYSKNIEYSTENVEYVIECIGT